MSTDLGGLNNTKILESERSPPVHRVVHYLGLYSKTWCDEAYAGFLRSFNEFLNQVGPLRYMPHVLSELIAMDIVPLWSMDIDTRKLEELLTLILRVKENKTYETELLELKERVAEFLVSLGVDRPLQLMNTCTSIYSEEECLVGITILALILSTNS